MSEPEETGTPSPQAETADEPRELFAFAAGGRLFAVFAEEADGVAENPSPAPLPDAPPAVLGVVSVRGRMRTVLDTAALVDEGARARSASTSTGPAPRYVVALRGDEQLALAADSLEGSFNVSAESLAPAGPADPPLLASLEREGRRLHLLDTARLFDAAMRGTERRRPRA